MNLIPLIDPAVPPSLDVALDMVGGIFTSNATDGYPFKQRYLAKVGHSSFSFRNELEASLARFLQLPPGEWSIFAVSKGVNALRLALRAVIPERERSTSAEVIVPAIGVTATVEAVLLERMRPVLIDVDPIHWHLDLDQVATSITPRTVGIISVDWLGTPVHLENFRDFANDYHLRWISDSAQSFGATWRDRPAAGFADAAIYSLGYPKVFHTAGRGGLLITRPENARILCESDPAALLRHEIMPELNAAFGLALLPAINDMLLHRRQMMSLYRERLGNIPGIHFPSPPPFATSNGYQISMQIDDDVFGLGANDLACILVENGVESSANRVPNLAPLYESISEVIKSPHLRNAEILDASTLTIPISNSIPASVCEHISHVIHDAYRAK